MSLELWIIYIGIFVLITVALILNLKEKKKRGTALDLKARDYMFDILTYNLVIVAAIFGIINRADTTGVYFWLMMFLITFPIAVPIILEDSYKRVIAVTFFIILQTFGGVGYIYISTVDASKSDLFFFAFIKIMLTMTMVWCAINLVRFKSKDKKITSIKIVFHEEAGEEFITRHSNYEILNIYYENILYKLIYKDKISGEIFPAWVNKSLIESIKIEREDSKEKRFFK